MERNIVHYLELMDGIGRRGRVLIGLPPWGARDALWKGAGATTGGYSHLLLTQQSHHFPRRISHQRQNFGNPRSGHACLRCRDRYGGDRRSI
jgi:hypothetical protein